MKKSWRFWSKNPLKASPFQLSSSRLLEACIRRAELVNKQINAIVQRHYDYAREEAKKVDDYVAKLDVKGKEYAEVCSKINVAFLKQTKIQSL